MARVLPLGLVALLAAAVVAGCGGVSLDPVAEAATKSADAGSFRFAFELSLGAGGSQAAALTGDGAYDAAASRVQARVGVGGETGELIMDMSSGTPAVYVKPPAGQGALPPGKTWGKVDLADAAKSGGFDLGPLTQGQLDPTKLLDVLRKAGDSTTVGKETIDGTETTHYRVTVDPAKAFAQKQQSKQEQEQARQALQFLGGSSVPVDVWVGDDGLLRRVGVQIGGKDALFAVGMRLDFSDYGSGVTVDLPPADQVAPELKLPAKTP
jgi:hypothetical protein